MTEITELLERVKAATGPDRAIDRDIAEHIVGTKFRSTKRGREWLVDSHGGEETWSRHAEPVTASIDAALALVERCGFQLGQDWNYTMAAAYGSFSIIPNDPNSTGIHDKRCGHAHGAPTIPIAILTALIQALIARTKK